MEAAPAPNQHLTQESDMQPKQQRKTAAPVAPAASAKKKRFRIEKLEERIAPARGGSRGSGASGSGGVSISGDSGTVIY